MQGCLEEQRNAGALRHQVLPLPPTQHRKGVMLALYCRRDKRIPHAVGRAAPVWKLVSKHWCAQAPQQMLQAPLEKEAYSHAHHE